MDQLGFIQITQDGLYRAGGLPGNFFDLNSGVIDKPARYLVAFRAQTRHHVTALKVALATGHANGQEAALLFAQGFGGIWRTGAYTQYEFVRQTMGLAEDDEIVGYLYLGTCASEMPQRPQLEVNEFFSDYQ